MNFSVSAMLSLLLVRGLSECSQTLSPGLGVHQYRFSTQADDCICINFTIAPFTFVTNEFGDETIYREYTYDMDGSVTFAEFAMRFLPLFRYIEDEFHSIEIYTPTQTDVSFMTVELPGMCHDGIYISTVDGATIELSRQGTNFYNLSVYDDKCFVFGPAQFIDLAVEIQSNDFEDQLYVHYNYSNFESISGNDTIRLHNYSSPDPVFIRLVADELSPPDLVVIMYDFVGSPGRHPRKAIRFPQNPLQVCDETVEWFDGPLVVVVLVVTLGLSLAFLVWVCVFTIRQTKLQADDDSPESMRSMDWAGYTAER
jgi:hypothetical protein